MTNEDIIKELTRMRKNFDSNSVYGSYCIDCLDAAIEALKEQPEHSQNTPQKQPNLNTLGIKTGETCEDVISRQDAYDVLTDYYHHRTEIQHKGLKEALSRVPSAQPEPIQINLNEPIKVKLTDWGKEIYYHQYDRTNQIAGRKICKPKFPKEDENGYTEFQLWCFIELYGDHIGMTLPNVIEPLEIVYER